MPTTPPVKMHTFRHITSALVSPVELMKDILNLEYTEEGTLATVPPAQEFIHEYSYFTIVDGTLFVRRADVTAKVHHGVFHAVLANNEDVMLAHVGNKLYRFDGSFNTWMKLYDLSNNERTFINSKSTRYPTQWVSTPGGIICIPAEGNALYYDGVHLDTLGFPDSPSAPSALGPHSLRMSAGIWFQQNAPTSIHDVPQDQNYGISTGSFDGSQNSVGYAHDGMPQFDSGIPTNFGSGRLGTVVQPAGLPFAQGQLLNGRYRAKVQFLDLWGNLSPLSPPSNDVTFDKQYSWMGALDGSPYDASGGAAGTIFAKNALGPGEGRSYPADGSKVKKQVAWVSIPKGPIKTIARILYRTKDLENSGETGYYELPQNAKSSPDDIGTIPDNIGDFYPDNIPDGWLGVPGEENIIPTPEFRIATLSFGRLWVGNLKDSPGAIVPSMPGLWGTFDGSKFLIPDPTGQEITGLKTTNEGLLAFTEGSSFLIVPNDDGRDFRAFTLSSTVGCVAPSSVVNVSSGSTIWLGRKGFYQWDGKSVSKISGSIDQYVNSINKGRVSRAVAVFNNKSNTYMCWVPYQGSAHNNTAFIFDGEGWRRQEVLGKVHGVMETNDHRNYIFAAGESVTAKNIFLLNAAWGTDNTSVIKSNWINVATLGYASLDHIFILLRDTEVEGKDERPPLSGPSTYASDYPLTYKLHINGKYNSHQTGSLTRTEYRTTSTYWGQTLDGTELFHRARLFWTKIPIEATNITSFLFELDCSEYLEIVGFAFNEIPDAHGYVNLPGYRASPGKHTL